MCCLADVLSVMNTLCNKAVDMLICHACLVWWLCSCILLPKGPPSHIILCWAFWDTYKVSVAFLWLGRDAHMESRVSVWWSGSISQPACCLQVHICA